jgi:site-specific DNA-adenine methylase
MWSYYGAKTNIIKFYPAPKYDKIIEPFCGTARYALRYFDHDILIVDKYDVMIKIWKWLQQCSPGDIDKLPRLKVGESLHDYTFDCEEAKLLTSFTIGFMSCTPRWTATIRVEQRPNHANHMLKQIASQLWKIKHWKIELGSYEEIPNQEATWFIDPPYSLNGGQHYKHHKIDYGQLRDWIKNREGQSIVCETGQASWLPFVPLVRQKTRGGWQHELIWSNMKTESDNIQKEIIFA